jgi:thiol-disulfide isomerase/thioredoxin
VLECPGGGLPFELVLERDDAAWTAAVLNGTERIEVGHVALDEGELLLSMEPYDSRLRARVLDGGTRLEGTWERYGGPERSTRLVFRAEHGDAPRFERVPLDEAARARLAGRWRVQFEQDEQPAVGVFECDADGRARGTFLTTLGDYRIQAGAFDGERLRLSCFDGAHAFLFDARLQEDGSLAGDFWSRDAWHERWTGVKDAQAELPDPFGLTSWTGAVPLEQLSFPDEQGVQRSLSDPAFAGKARIITLFGTWCPNCNDEARWLSELDARFGERGLSILGLAFEFGGELERDARQVQRFRERHDVQYPILIAGVADKAKASRAFPVIDRLRAYPTAIFLDGGGTVRAIHTGFSGPATGAAYERLREKYESLIEELLASAD